MNQTIYILVGLNIVTLITVIFLYFKALKPQSNNKMMESHFLVLEKGMDKMEKSLREEIVHNRQESHTLNKSNREEISAIMVQMNQSMIAQMGQVAQQQNALLDTFSKQLAQLTSMNEVKLDKVKETVEKQLQSLQEDNSRKLEAMRATVDEKLHATLEKRLGESFKLVSDRLEMVHKGLGEMQSLASGVGDLKKVLTNVKSRGTLGEIQLENLLEQTLTVEQYQKNVITKQGSNDRIEFAIELPHRDGSGHKVLLPIDSKFPIEDYQVLVDAQEQGDVVLAQDALKKIEVRIKREAKTIREKYIDPPYTTDFAIMFLPIEGLYAEVLRCKGLWETLQRDYKIVVTGPTTLSAFLNSLQMGFRSLAIQKHSSEVWEVLGAVKTEFARFGDILDKTKKKLQEASNTIDSASVRSRAIERKLKNIEALPESHEPELFSEVHHLASSE